MDDAVLSALKRAVDAAPGDLELKLHYARALAESAGRHDEAIATVSEVVAGAPSRADARALLLELLNASPSAASPPEPSPSERPIEYDWSAAEAEVRGVVQPRFEERRAETGGDAFVAERPGVRLDDVGGMTEVKRRLDAAFLAPMRNPRLRDLYGKSLRGGLLLYGPPGCGKTYIARALAGELGAGFLSASITDILDPYVGVSEHNVHELFQIARRDAPCVLFFDEVDTLGQKRSSLRGSATLRNVVNQLLTEMDGVDGSNEGVFVLAASNQPWEVDPALRRPGLLDRMVLVAPPDTDARAAIFRHHLSQRPVEGIDLNRLAKATGGFSGADIAYVCELAAEHALMDSIANGEARMIAMPDLDHALTEVQPSTGPWLDAARTIVTFGDEGAYPDLKAFLKKSKRL
ncbi:MAG: AAA family ATPase [Microbacterium sp.]|nr:AAA family ATPase [Microbacterium sp.]